jgi:hypothetical protein
MRFAFGPRVEGSWVRFSGSSALAGVASSSGDAFVFSPGLRASVILFDAIALEAAAGTTMFGATANADDRPIASVDGAFVSGTVSWSSRFYLD